MIKESKTRKPHSKEEIKRLSATYSFLPSRIINEALETKKTPEYEYLSLALFYGDISGFTAMSEKLAKLGKEGAEEVTKIINHFFAPLIEIVLSWGGDIFRFGGDSILAVFYDNEGKLEKETRALEAAKQTIDFVKKHSRIKAKKRFFQVKMHIAISSGNVYLKDLNTDFFIGGKFTQKAVNAVDTAKAGEIVVNSQVRKFAQSEFVRTDRGLWKCKTKKPTHKKSGKLQKISPLRKDSSTARIALLNSYLTDWIQERINLKPTFDPKDGEHRKATSVFLYFSGIPYDVNQKKASTLLLNFYKTLKTITEKYGGYLNKLDVAPKGERAIIVFGAPSAFEDDERRATLFAYELLQSPLVVSKEINLRVGINSGFMFFGPVGSELRREYTVMGDTVNLTARIASVAKKNEILVSESVFNKVYGFFNYETLPIKTVKGKKEKIRLYRILEKKTIDESLLSKWLSESEKIVGRDTELHKIRKSIASVMQGKGQILAITGEAGIGKSRLTQELIRELKKKKFKIFEGDCISFGSAFSYHPWVDVLADFFSILPDDTMKERKRKIRKAAISVNPKLKEWLPVIGEIMGVSYPETSLTKFLDAKIKKQRVFDITFDLLKHTAKTKPVCVIIEDLHWADSASLELANYIGRNIKDKPFLLALVFRPLKKKEEFLEKKFATLIKLKELKKEDSLALLKNLLNIKDIPAGLKKIIVEKSQGNPFYIEELVKSLIEQGYVIEEKGKWKFSGDIKKLELPDSLEAVILNRIDRLDIRERDVLQVASVLGREFDDFIIKGIYPNSLRLKKSLNNLQRLDLIKPQKGKKHLKYFFKHILTREVAYETLSYARRRELHRETGNFIEKQLKDRRSEFLGLLSYHFYLGKDFDKSLLYSVQAGEKAQRVYANEEAIEFFTRAIESYGQLEK